jgi:endonuclease/exonuclease/phosphatase family metal-dependent hydrolase
MKQLIHSVAIVLLTLVCAAAIFFAVMGIKAYRPQTVEIVYSSSADTAYWVDSLTITSWNIGYAAMDADADFFMDGGKMVRNTEPQVRQNIQNIAAALQKIHSNIFLLQELDIAARRSYYVNQFGLIQDYLLDYQGYFALNFSTLYVPVPIHNPIGKVEAGIGVFSHWQPYNVERYAYPNYDGVPTKWFNLQRCFMVCRFALAGQKELVVVNTHNSAFDNGDGRMGEAMMLKEFLHDEYAKGNYVIAGGDWNQTPPQVPCHTGTPQYTPMPLPPNFLPDDWTISADTLHPSVRFANKPYRPDSSLTATVDFFVLSPNIAVKSIATVPLQFAHSDHNPVQITILFR